MKQLTGLDASFVYLESQRTPMHIGSLMIYDQSKVPGGYVTFKEILEMFSSRVHLAEQFRQRIVTVPLGLDHPYWADDPDFDLEYHVRHVGLPAPNDWRQLCILVARIHSRPLDMTRPLWEVTVIEGLDNVDGIPKGSFAVVYKVHHAAIDGVSGAELATVIHDLEPTPPRTEPPKWEPLPLPSQAEMLARAGINNLRQPLRLSKLLAEAGPAVRSARHDAELTMPIAPSKIPHTRFSSVVSAHRVFEARSFDLSMVKEIKNAQLGATVNDVVLTVCGGAMRRYLDHHDETPESTLVAMAPISIRVDGGAGGNQITNMSVALHTDIDDEAERLRAVSKSSQAAKKLTERVGSSLLAEAAQSIPSLSMVMAGRLYGRLGERLNPPFNCVITNVPGPQFPIYSTGAELVTFFGFGPLVDGLGLFMPIFSYDGKITIAVTSCREIMPDPDVFAEAITTEFEALYRSVVSAPASPSGELRTSAPVKEPEASGTAARKPAVKEPSEKRPAQETPAETETTEKRVAGNRSAAKKSAAKQPSRKAVAKKKPSAKRTAGRGSTVKKSAAKRAVGKGSAVKKSAGKQPSRKAVAVKKSAAKRAVGKGSAVKKSAGKHSSRKAVAVKKSTAKRTAGKGSTVKKSAAKRAVGKGSALKKSAGRHSSRKAVAVKKSTAKRTAGKGSAGKQSSRKAVVAKKSAAKQSSRKAVAVKKSTAKRAVGTGSAGKQSSKKAVALKKSAAKRAVGKGSVGKQSSRKAVVAKKSAAKKLAGRQSPRKAVDEKKSTAKRTTGKKSTAKQAARKRSAAKKPTAKQAVPKVPAAKKPASKHAVGSRSAVKKSAGKLESQRTAAKKEPVGGQGVRKHASPKARTAKLPALKIAVATNSTVERGAAKKPAGKQAAAANSPVRNGGAIEAASKRTLVNSR